MNCPKCNYPLESGDVFCPECGVKLEAEQPQRPSAKRPEPSAMPAQKKRSPTSKRLLLIVLLVAGIAGGIAGSLAIYNGSVDNHRRDGIAAYESGNWEEAVRLLQFGTNPRVPKGIVADWSGRTREDAFIFKGFSEIELGRYTNALESLLQVEAGMGSYYEYELAGENYVQAGLAYCYDKLGDPAKAVAHYINALNATNYFSYYGEGISDKVKDLDLWISYIEEHGGTVPEPPKYPY